jgi:diguanylate cyclase (GGDEF)-like protein
VELERLATTDGLTALNNRRTLDLRLEDEWHHALRSGSFLSVLFIDIDRFKLYNDTYGHAAGDDMLALVARSIEEAVRRSIDCVGRYGGEEFVAILPATTSEGAMFVGELVRKRIEALDVANPGSETSIVTVSIGCATCRPSHEMRVDDLVAEADKQLYRAKSSGRNRVLASVLLKEEAA